MEVDAQDYANLKSDVRHLQEVVSELKGNNKKMAEDVEEIKEDQIEMKHDIKYIMITLSENSRAMEKLCQQIEKQEEKSKFDILEWVKTNFISIVIGVYCYLKIK